MNNMTYNEPDRLGLLKGYILDLQDYGGKIAEMHVERSQALGTIVQANGEITDKIEQQLEAAESCSQLALIFQQYFDMMAQSADSLAQSASQATATSGQSERSIRDLLDANRNTQTQFAGIVDKVGVLVQKAKDIDSIIAVIIRIARQTNLLSINASIEAARAGTAGKGFAVVAEEIKRLANETQREGEAISSLIGGITTEIMQIQTFSDNARQDFTRQEDSINSASTALSDIGSAVGSLVEQQSQIAGDIENLVTCKDGLVEAIDDIVDLTGQTVAISQMVSSISLESASRDGLGHSMVQTQQSLVGEIDQLIGDVKAVENNRKTLRIGFSALEKQDFYQEVENAANAVGRMLNIEVICRSPSRFDVQEQANIFRSFIEEDMDGIIVVPSDADRFRPLIEEAEQKGIPVACIDADVPQSRRSICVTSDSYDGGKLSGEAAIRQLKGRGRIAVMLCASQVPTVQQRLKGFQDAIARCPDMKITSKIEQQEIGRAHV